MTKYVYVVYRIDKKGENLDILRVFENHKDAKRYAELYDNQPRILQRPLKDIETSHKEYRHYKKNIILDK